MTPNCHLCNASAFLFVIFFVVSISGHALAVFLLPFFIYVLCNILIVLFWCLSYFIWHLHYVLYFVITYSVSSRFGQKFISVVKNIFFVCTLCNLPSTVLLVAYRCCLIPLYCSRNGCNSFSLNVSFFYCSSRVPFFMTFSHKYFTSSQWLGLSPSFNIISCGVSP